MTEAAEKAAGSPTTQSSGGPRPAEGEGDAGPDGAAHAARSAVQEPALFTPPVPVEVDPESIDGDTLTGIVYRQSAARAGRESLSVKTPDGWRPITWHQLHTSAQAVAAALIHHGVERGDRVAILAENRLEWLHCDFGIQATGAVVVPIYASCTAEQVAQILSNSGAVGIFCSTPAQAEKVAQIRRDVPSLRLAVLFDGEADGFTSLARFVPDATAADVATLAERLRATRPEDTLTIIYTSGTTGTPKGVVLTHANIVGSCRPMLERVHLDESDKGISFLPWAHVYERVHGIFIGMIVGVTAAIAPNLEDIPGDLRSVRPTIMNGVPRIYEKMQEAIVARIQKAGGARARLGMRALNDCVEAARLRRAGRPVPPALRIRTRVWERLVIEQIREALGGRIRMLSSGGGPLNIGTLEFFDGLGIAITEGYGLTETTSGITANDPRDPHFGTVGQATRGHELRIAEDGEILVRGPAVMQGYFNDRKATEDVLRDGWFATGDIGELDAQGYLRITDRKKELIVTAGGKNVAPSPIEGDMMRDSLVERAIVIGDQRKYLVALVVPDFAALRSWASSNGVSASTDAELAGNEKVQELYQKIAERSSSKLAKFETIKKVAVIDRDLDESRGELTPTLKVKRRVVAESFKDIIDSLYQG